MTEQTVAPHILHDDQFVMSHVRCRSCGDTLQPVLNLGHFRLNAFPATRQDLESVPKVRLQLAVCQGCSLAQLTDTVPADWLYREYWYRSAVNESMVEELTRIVREGASQVALGAIDYVLDIGANDGTLLKAWKDQPYPPIRVGVEPARNLHDQLAQHADVTVTDYFPTQALDNLRGRFRVITAIAMAYDLEQPIPFFQKLADLLHRDGIAIVQFQDLAQQIQCAAFDNICHEHLEYYTLSSLLTIVRHAGLDVVKCQTTPINGGSLRVTLRHATAVMKGAPVDRSVMKQLLAEEAAGLSLPAIHNGDFGAFDRFSFRVRNATVQIQSVLQQVTREGGGLDIYGASTKGNITLQQLGVGPEQARQCIDRNPEKHGRLTITGVPIVGEEEGRQQPAGTWLCNIWQFREQVVKRERQYLKQGGTMVFPLPHAEIVREGW